MHGALGFAAKFARLYHPSPSPAKSLRHRVRAVTGCGSRGAIPPARLRTKGDPGAKERLGRERKTTVRLGAARNGVLHVLLGGMEQPLPEELGYRGDGCQGVDCSECRRGRACAGGTGQHAGGAGSSRGRQLGVSLAHVGRPLLPFHPQTSPICCSCIYTPSNF